MNNEISLSQEQIETHIFTIQGMQVMIDRDLARMYHVETRVLNQAVKRNIDRFPKEFCFQLTESEFKNWMSQIVISNEDKMGLRKRPYVFTEQGVAMLSAVLRSTIAIKVSVQIIKAFVEMRKTLIYHNGLLQRVENVERRQLETDYKFEKIFQALENKDTIPLQGLFFDGQVFDAYEFTSKIIRSAKSTIVLIDNYIDETTLVHLSKKEKGVNVILYTKSTSKQLLLDVQKANEQYGNFKIKSFSRSHDRFLIVDNNEVYHLGASLKDLGKRWFAFSKMDKNSVSGIITELNKI